VDKVNVGLIGAGGMANGVHYPSLYEMKDVNMVALCDLVEDKLNATAERFGIEKKYTDYREMIEKEDLDAVYILMPPHHLFDIAINCLQKKLHVFIEKPPAITTFQIQSMARVAKENGCLSIVGFNRRYIPMLNYAKKYVEEKGNINQVVATFYKNGSAIYYNGAIDVISCDAIHAVDTLRWLAGGEVTAVSSLVSQYNDVVPNSWNAIVRFDNGVSGVLLTNWAVGARIHQFELHAKGASAYLDPDTKGRILEGNDVKELDTFELAGSKERHKFYGFYDQSRHFIDSIKAGKEPLSNFADAVKTMQLVDMIKANAIG
jgi:virulence factor